MKLIWKGWMRRHEPHHAAHSPRAARMYRHDGGRYWRGEGKPSPLPWACLQSVRDVFVIIERRPEENKRTRKIIPRVSNLFEMNVRNI